MASRRLDISSLLCDDNQPPFSPLEVLVQAATEERKRLGVADDPQHRQNSPSDTRQSPVIDNHVAQSPRLSPHISRYHIDDTQRIHLTQQPLYLQRTRPHHDNLTYPQYQQHHSQSSRDFDFLLGADRRRRLQEAEHQQRLQEQQRIQDLEYQRQQEHERAYRAQELERRRREEDHLRLLEYKREMEHREAERLHQQLAEEKRREVEKQQELRQSERQFELERQRAATEKQHSQQFVNEQRSFFDMHSQHFPARQSSVVSPTSNSRLISNTDPPQISQSTSSISPESSANSVLPSQHDPRPIKKRRYSISPTRHDDQDRIARDRDRMAVGELGYGRVDSPVAGPSAPRRPGSHNQPRKTVAVADLLSDKEPPPPSPLSQLARPEPRDPHKILSPTSRRSPPGSQIGRAKAARKSDDYIASLREHAQPPPPTTKDSVESPILPEPTKSTEDLKVKQEPKPNRLRYIPDEIRRTPTTDESRQKKAPPPPKMQSSNSKSKQRDDPHEFFLHQYDQVPTPEKSAKPAHLDSGGMPSPSSNPISPTPSVVTPNLPAASSVVALDKELEDLVSSPTSSHVPTTSALAVKVKKQEESEDMDLAVDLAVTELVENLENDGEKHVGMEVDVEDELLSLVDDRSSTNASRRPAAPLSISAPNSHVSDLSSQLPSGSKQQHSSMNRSASDILHPSVPATSSASASGAAVQVASSIARSSSARATSDRDSMPPPATTTKGGAAKKTVERAGSVIPPEHLSTTNPGKKKKETTAKVSNAKSKAVGATTAKPKARAPAKSKKAATETATGRATPPSVPKTTKGGKKTGSASGSRSASVVPGGSPVTEGEAAKATKEEEEEEGEEGDNEDDKLYCICKTRYDESRLMIACDKCDEWYHTLCVNMPDLDVDLVDQFFCPSCIAKYPQSNLRTTYKQRCLWGLRHPNPDSPRACHKAARGAFSKYCSDECGVKYMQTRVDSWAKKGGKTDKLWESVKDAERREGIVVCAVDATKMDTESDADGHPVKSKIVRPSKTKIERETERLKDLLSSIVKMREGIQHGMEIIVCRERLLQLASERAEQVGQCGWDQRLCCDDEELVDIGAGMLESYEDAKVDGTKEENGDADMEVDGHEEQWWCPGKKVCDRHAGWQTIRYKDVCKEKEMKEEALAKLTLRERDLRKRIEDIHDPHASNTKKSKTNSSNAPLKSTAKVNGHTKSKVTTAEKKGKKRKAPSS